MPRATPNDGFEFVIPEPGVELSVQRSGEGPTVLLVGGLGMPSITWEICGPPRSLVDAGFQVIAYNARGMSPSSAPAAPYSVADLAGDAAAIGRSGACRPAEPVSRRLQRTTVSA